MTAGIENHFNMLRRRLTANITLKITDNTTANKILMPEAK
jgi:hypothetical protein